MPARFREYYPEGFTLQSFFKHLSEHLYWVAYYERYNKAPWPAELHGDDAMIELLCEDIDDTLRNKVKFEVLRKLYKKKFGHGIAKSKLARRLKEQSFITRFIGFISFQINFIFYKKSVKQSVKRRGIIISIV